MDQGVQARFSGGCGPLGVSAVEDLRDISGALVSVKGLKRAERTCRSGEGCESMLILGAVGHQPVGLQSVEEPVRVDEFIGRVHRGREKEVRAALRNGRHQRVLMEADSVRDHGLGEEAHGTTGRESVAMRLFERSIDHHAEDVASTEIMQFRRIAREVLQELMAELILGVGVEDRELVGTNAHVRSGGDGIRLTEAYIAAMGIKGRVYHPRERAQWRWQAVDPAGDAGQLPLEYEAGGTQVQLLVLIGKHIWTEYPDGVGQPFHQGYLKALET